MEFRAFVAKAPHLTIPRQRTLVYGGKLLFSNAAAKLPKALSQKRHDGFLFLNDGNLDKCLSKKKIRLATPALWLSSPHWAKCLTKSKFLETACKNYCTHTSAPRHVRVPRSRNFSDWRIWVVETSVWEFFSYNSTKDLLCRSTSTSRCRTFSIATHTTVKVRLHANCKRLSAAIRAAKVSDVDRRTNTIHVRSAFLFARCALAKPNEVKRRLSRSNGERFPPCFWRWWRCGQSITHWALFCHLRRCSDVLCRS